MKDDILFILTSGLIFWVGYVCGQYEYEPKTVVRIVREVVEVPKTVVVKKEYFVVSGPIELKPSHSVRSIDLGGVMVNGKMVYTSSSLFITEKP